MNLADTTQRNLAIDYFSSTVDRWEDFYIDRGECMVYDVIYRSRLAAALSLVDGLGLPEGSRCLDIGCGPGFATIGLAKRGFVVHAIDLVKAQLDRTQQRAAEAGVAARIATSTGDIHNLTLSDEGFDVVLVIGVMEWLEDPIVPLLEVSRVLKPGGYAIIAVDNKWALSSILDPLNLLNRIRTRLWRWAGKRLSWYGLRNEVSRQPRTYSYSVRRFDQLMCNAGLEKTLGITVGFGPWSFLGFELPQAVGVRVHQRLQRLADRQIPLLKGGGLVYVTVGKRAAVGR